MANIYVDLDAATSGDGTSGNPYDSIYEAMASSDPNDTIIVSQGGNTITFDSEGPCILAEGYILNEGILDPNNGYFSYGIFDGYSNHPFGILDSTGEHRPYGILDSDAYYNTYGILDYSGGYEPYGILDPNSGYFISYGIFDGYSNHHPFGILDSTGEHRPYGILDISGTLYDHGILDYSGGYEPYGILDISGTLYDHGILIADYYDSGVLDDYNYWPLGDKTNPEFLAGRAVPEGQFGGGGLL